FQFFYAQIHSIRCRRRSGDCVGAASKASREDRVELLVGDEANRASERAFVSTSVLPAQHAFPVTFAVSKADHTIKIEIIGDMAVEEVGIAGVLCNVLRACDGEVRLSAASAALLRCSASRLIVDDGVAKRLLHLP